MVSTSEVNKQLKKTGYYYRFWMRKEVRELRKVLDEGETIMQCVNGFYQGGMALLAATDRRLLLIDYKPMYLTLEIIWYDKIGQIDYNHRMLNASICISTPNKELNFTSYNTQHLRKALLFMQVKIAEVGLPDQKEENTSQSNISFRGQTASELAAYPTVIPSQQAYVSNRTNTALETEPLSTPNTNFTASANRLPFSRRRYFAEQESEPIA